MRDELAFALIDILNQEGYLLLPSGYIMHAFGVYRSAEVALFDAGYVYRKQRSEKTFIKKQYLRKLFII